MKSDGKKYYDKKVLPFLKKLKRKTEKYIAKGKYERALDDISVAANVLYETNQYLYDEQLERYTAQISDKFSFSTPHSAKKKVLFFDGFGMESRGLAKIYLSCLADNYDTVYCTLKRFKDRIPALLNILGKRSKIYYIDDVSYVRKVKDISDIIIKENPSDMFIYITPFDVSAITAFTAYRGKGKRYLINLTDHAFWLGRNAYDRLIEFRDYGAYLSLTERKETAKKIVKIPMYPDVKSDVEFLGFPFSFDSKTQKLFFSGGSVYKTIGKDGKFYKIVERILTERENTVFWYAGSGDCEEMIKLKNAFPHRVYHTAERTDLYAVLKRCTFYLSTYPICGNLMIQYAAAAGVAPLTLKNGNDADGSLKEQDKLGILFDDEKALVSEAEKLIDDDNYRENRKIELIDSVMSKSDFDTAIINLIDNGGKTFAVMGKYIEDKGFKNLYLARVGFSLVADCVAKKGRKNIFDFPIYYFCGCTKKAFGKILKKNKG